MKRSDFTVKRLPSGFWCVWFRGSWINASIPSEEAAEALIDTMIKANKLTF